MKINTKVKFEFFILIFDVKFYHDDFCDDFRDVFIVIESRPRSRGQVSDFVQ